MGQSTWGDPTRPMALSSPLRWVVASTISLLLIGALVAFNSSERTLPSLGSSIDVQDPTSELASSGTEHAGEDCWGGCHERQGRCSWCGNGYCCRLGWSDHSNGCDGSIGYSHNQHMCTSVWHSANPTASPTANPTESVAPVGGFLRGTQGSNVCPADSVSVGTEAQCRSAASALGETFQTARSLSDYPKGCILPGNGYVYFNQAETGAAQPQSTSICAESTANPTASPTANPTAAPSDTPTAAPSDTPTAAPTDAPTAAPSAEHMRRRRKAEEHN